MKIKKDVNYKLALLLQMKIHSVFYVFLLKSADSETSVQETPSEINLTSQDVEFKIEKILDK